MRRAATACRWVSLVLPDREGVRRAWRRGPHSSARGRCPTAASRRRPGRAPPGRGTNSRCPGSPLRTRWRDGGRRRRGEPTCSIRPWFMTTTRSATSNASSWSCVTKMLVTWISSCSRRSQCAQLRADLGVQGPERLVEQQHPRLDRQRPRQADALPLAAGKLRRVALLHTFQLDQPQQLAHLSRNRGRRGRFLPRRTRSPKAMFSATVMWRKRA